MDVALPSSRPVSSRSTCDAGGLEVCGLDPTLLPKALAIRDWLLPEAAQLADPGQISPGLAERLIALGIPIDRIMSAIDLLHSEYSGIGRIWTKEGARPLASSRIAPTAFGWSTTRARSPTFTAPGTGCSSTSHRPRTIASTSSR